MTERLLQIVISKTPPGEYKISGMGDGQTLETEYCEKGAILPIVAALLPLLVAPEPKK